MHWAMVQKPWDSDWDYSSFTARADLESGPGGGRTSGMLSGVWCTINNQLRTGTDKGNLTV